jgi:hypothetical protein
VLTPFLDKRTKHPRDTGCWLYHAGGMDEKAIRQAALITLRRAILERFPPGRERIAWLRWLRAHWVTEAPTETHRRAEALRRDGSGTDERGERPSGSRNNRTSLWPAVCQQVPIHSCMARSRYGMLFGVTEPHFVSRRPIRRSPRPHTRRRWRGA